jgi:hypothetical protein
VFIVDSNVRGGTFKKLLEQWKSAAVKRSYGRDVHQVFDRIENIVGNVCKQLQQEQFMGNTIDTSIDDVIEKTLKLPPTEAVIDHFACGMEEGRLVIPAGRLYITQNYVAFHESLGFGRARKEILEFADITAIDKRNSSVWLVPNAIQIFTNSRKLFFSSFFNQNDVYEILKECWITAQKRLVCSKKFLNFLFISLSYFFE